MAILVVCPGCTSRFSVSDKFAGKTGPCPKCKKPITVPRPTAGTVTIHEAEPAATAGPGGKPLTVPFKSLDAPIPPLAFALGGAGAFILVVAARLVGFTTGGNPSPWLSVPTAFLVAFPCAAIGYAILRNRELEPYKGSSLMRRCLACAAVYGVLWCIRSLLPPDATGDMWQWLYLGPPFLAAGALTALAAFDLEWGSAATHFSFYVFFTAMLRWLAGLPPL